MSDNHNEAFVRIEDAHKSYRLGKTEVSVLKGINLSVEKGEWLALLGASGSGKTTLLNLVGLLEKPDQGKISCGNRDYQSISARQGVQFRCNEVGFIFQAYHMFPELSVLENVLLPSMLAKKNRREAQEHAVTLLERVGLGHRVGHRPNELSGGEQQRAAIARALINSPDLVLADEPTGNLDSETGKGILEILQELHASKDGKTIIMVTHDQNVASLADRIVRLKDGVIEPYSGS